ncbi:MAG: TadE family protein [Micromonosporaceae bacterium]
MSTRSRSRDRGAAAVEFALLLPILLIIVFGIIDFGRMLNAQVTLTEAAREGARAESLGSDPNARVATATTNLDGVSTSVDSACPGEDAIVTVNYEFTFVTPLSPLLGLFGGGLDGTVPMSGKGVMPCFT